MQSVFWAKPECAPAQNFCSESSRECKLRCCWLYSCETWFNLSLQYLCSRSSISYQEGLKSTSFTIPNTSKELLTWVCISHTELCIQASLCTNTFEYIPRAMRKPMMASKVGLTQLIVATLILTSALARGSKISLQLDLSNTHPVSDLLYGIFFEEVTCGNSSCASMESSLLLVECPWHADDKL